MRPLHIIMPMAGEGSRFLQEGWTTPKPLIQLNGKCLFERAVGSVADVNAPMKYSFIVRQEHIDHQNIDKLLKEVCPEAQVFSVLHTTRGAVETCLKAENVIAKDDAILVMDCDLEFRSKGLSQFILETLQKNEDQVDGGALVSFNSQDSRYSYAQVDSENRVLRTAEKEVISNHALCGAYFFSTARDFLSAAHRLLNEPVFTKPEFYVSLLYNFLLKDCQDVRLFAMEEYYSYGTPEELKRYL